ncbi:MAG: hypothetical protein PVI39_13355, partial [Desulfobacteraceae bacterium]
LERRAALGGAFANLQQVRAVPLVGPERFTEIVTALTGRRPPGAAAPQGDALLAELRELRAAVAALQAAAPTGLRVSLHGLREMGFLGQPLPLLVTVSDAASGKPQPHAALTLTTSWGDLQSFAGFGMQFGPVLSLRTNPLGEARMTLRTPTCEALTGAQQAALETALRGLDPAAATPAATLAGLQNMAAAYGLERNSELRGAVDIYFQTWRERVSDTVNTRALLNTWQFHDALVTALVHPEDEGTMIAAAAACRVRLKDWVGPWFQAYAGLISQKNGLGGEFERIQNGETDKDVLLERLLSSVHGYVAGQRGRAGEVVGQKVAERTIRHFMATRLPKLPLDTQLTLMPTLDIAHRNVGAAGMGTLATVSRATTNLKKTVDRRVGQIGVSGVLAERLAGIEARLGKNEIDYGTFRRDYEQFTAQVEGFRAELGTFTSRYNDFSSRYATFNNNYTIFSRDYQTFSTNYTRFSQEYTAFNRDYGAFGRNFADFNQNYGRFSENYAVFARDFTRFARDFADFSSRYKDFGRSYADFRTTSGATLAALETFRADYDKFAADFQTFAANYQTFRADYGKFSADLQRVNTDLRTFTTTYRSFETNFRKFSTDYKSFQIDYERFRTIRRG